MKLNIKFLKNLIREQIKEAKWNNSPDEDFPAMKAGVKKYRSDKVIIFDIRDQYGDTGADSHGRDSHMAKHWFEFGEDIQASIKKTKEIIKNYAKENKVYHIEGSQGYVPIEIDVANIKDGDILNTYDHINDKMFDGIGLLDVEKEIYNKAMMLAISPYDKEADNIMAKAIDVSDAEMKDEENLIKVLQKNNFIKFKATYGGSVKTYYYDTARTALIAELDDGSIATLYRLRNKGKDKKENPVSAIRGFNSNGATRPTDEYSLLRTLADNEKAKILARNQPKKKKKAKPVQRKKQSVSEFVAGRLEAGLSPETIKTILTKKYPKMPEQAIDNILKKAGAS